MEDRTVFQPAPGGSVRPGVRLNGVYEVERLIAEGGMGEVYKGFAIQTGDAVAIKMIKPEMSRSPDAMALFRREASILHNLQNDAVVRYYVFSVDPDLQRAYLAMEFVDGPSLSRRLQSGPLPTADVLILKARIAGALEAAHRLGVVHRDISSDNVILPAGDVRRAKIIDFGIARTLGAAEGTIIGGGFAGKYNYVSPEQLGLAGGDVTFKSDIYSFGLVLAEALRGQPIDMGGSQVEVVDKRRRVPDLSSVDPAIRPLLQAMLQPLPADRPASMAAVAAWGEGSATDQTRPASGAKSDRAAPRASRGGGLAMTLAGLAALISVAGAAYVFRDDLLSALAPKPGVATPPQSGGQVKPPPLPPSAPSGGETKPPPLPPPAGGETKPPPLPPPPASGETKPPAVEPAPTEPASGVPAPTPAPAPSAPHVPTKEELIDAMPPKALQPSFVLGEAKVGAPFRQELPAFLDPGGKGLTVEAVGLLPPGLSLKDLGGGHAAIEGSPAGAGTMSFAVRARNHNGAAAEMRVTATVNERAAPAAPAPAPPPQKPAEAPQRPTAEAPKPAVASATLEPATVGQDYHAALPVFEAGANGGAVALRVERGLPDGLAFVDLGAGHAELVGRPTRDGGFAFDVVATNSAGLTSRLSAKIAIARASLPSGPPRPAQSEVSLPQATVGQDYSAALPLFELGANARSVSLHIDRALPEGLAFTDSGGGAGRISGRPLRDAVAAFDIIATNDKGLSARLTARLVVTPAPLVAGPPRPSLDEATLENATVGRDYVAQLPPFDPGANARGVTLRMEPAPPEGLTFSDLGGGLSQLAGQPAHDGAFSVAVVALNDAGLTAHMTVRIVVAPAPAEPAPVAPNPVAPSPAPAAPSAPNPQEPSPVATPGESAQAFIRAYNGGSCFAATPAPGGGATDIVAIGADKSAFEGFERAFVKATGAEPTISARLVLAQECPAVDLLRLTGAGGTAAPRVDLATAEVGKGRPLAGTISGLAGRKVTVLVIDNDGQAHRLDAKPAPGGDAATFTAPLVGDESSMGLPQVLLAIASEAPLAATESFRHGAAGDLAQKLAGQWSEARAGASLALFKLTR